MNTKQKSTSRRERPLRRDADLVGQEAGDSVLAKTEAINQILANHQDNLAAVKAAGVPEGLMDVVTEALNESLKADLDTVFATTKRASG